MFVKILSGLMTVLLVTRICSLMVNQTTLYLKLARQYEEQRQKDIYTANVLCQNEEMLRGMGEINTRICQDIEERVHLNPKVAALKEVLDQTYLCGDEACANYIKDGFHFVFSDWKAGAIVSILVIIVVNCSGCFGIHLKFLNRSKRRPNYDTAPDVCIRDVYDNIPFNTLPYSRQFHYSTGNHVQEIPS